ADFNAVKLQSRKKENLIECADYCISFAAYMMDPREIKASHYQYELPDERIASWPLEKRSASKLLVWSQGQIKHSHFYNLGEELAAGDTLFLNHTKVIPARLLFHNRNGGAIEVFCLEPSGISIELGMASSGQCNWYCLVGGARKWRDDEALQISKSGTELSARIVGREEGRFQIQFTWLGVNSFSDVLTTFGNIPLPPYFKRDAVESDWERYQTVFARYEGSVAAPTASLHFDDELLQHLPQRGIAIRELSLHVGAGTFKPVTSETMKDHDMHAEPFSVPLATIESCMNVGRCIAVGTTAMRTLESLYWLGRKILLGKWEDDALVIGQWEPYDEADKPSKHEALSALIQWMKEQELHTLCASTSLMIAPGYRMRVCDGLITNFHQPGSTLILLVAAATGNQWRAIYDEALRNEYRFLSYGDSSLLWINSSE
ncbi:MAG: S-adenosylmethionine:tRNA ribosyltransferase-isomerase, partial [Flavobacteriales bacterium]